VDTYVTWYFLTRGIGYSVQVPFYLISCMLSIVWAP